MSNDPNKYHEARAALEFSRGALWVLLLIAAAVVTFGVNPGAGIIGGTVGAVLVYIINAWVMVGMAVLDIAAKVTSEGTTASEPEPVLAEPVPAPPAPEPAAVIPVRPPIQPSQPVVELTDEERRRLAEARRKL